MWIFGYGSLMWDGWEAEFACERRVTAQLPGYRRVFNKASVKNWGTPECPCPTLNLVADPLASCIGIAFQFPERRVADVKSYLAKREGKNFPLIERIITVDDMQVMASTSLYNGAVLDTGATSEMLAAIRSAEGTRGLCRDYIAQAHAQLDRLGIDDPSITELWNRLRT